MIQWIKGASIQDDKKLHEGYKIEAAVIKAVLNVDSIMKVFHSFLKHYETHNCFLFLEVPCKLDEETQISENRVASLHKNVYYLDNIWVDEASQLLTLFEDILVNDGFAAFGIGNHEAEIGKYRYNEVLVYTEKTDELKRIFDENGICEDAKLLLPGDIISIQNLGVSSSFKDNNGRDIYDIVETL